MTSDSVPDNVPKYHQLMYPCLKALKALGDSGANEEILDKIIELENYSSEVQQAQHTDHKQTALNYRLAWAKTFLKQAGALENNDRGVWTLTEKGGGLTEEDCRRIPAENRKATRLKKGKTESTANIFELDDEDPSGEQDDLWQDKLLSVLLQLKPDAFERR